MPLPGQVPSRRRSLVTFPEEMKVKLAAEAKRRGLRLAEYLRYLVSTHPERADGALPR